MAGFSVEEIAAATGGRLIRGSGRATRGVVIDSRKVRRGSLFVAIKGSRFDGHEFVREAFQKGAAAALVSEPALAMSLAGKTVIVVEETIRALQDLAASHRRRFRRLKVIAVTGSNGKTTVKEMIARAISGAYRTLKTEGNLNNHIGLPLTLLRLSERSEAAVLEMGMNAPGEIGRLTGIARPSIGVITNVGPAHIGAFRSLAAVGEAKAEMIDAMPKSAAAVLNADDPNSRPIIEKARQRLRKTVTFGRSPCADMSLVDTWANGGLGHYAAIYHKGRETLARVPLMGAKSVENALAALAAASLAGVGPERAAGRIARVKPASMRMEPVRLGNGALVINDSYNANPASTEAALKTLAELDRGRKIFVFGDMLELGRRAETAHRRIGRLAAEAGVDYVYALGKLASLTAGEARRKGLRTKNSKSAHAIARSIAAALKPGDIVLVKGSRGMEMERVVEILAGITGGR